MPRYFFDTADGSRDRDLLGTELRDLDDARTHAIKFAGVILGAEPELLAGSRQFRVEVRNAAGKLLVTIVALAIDAEIADK